MKEFMGNAVNLGYIEDDDGDKRALRATAEIILIVSEPVFRADASGQMTRQREVETLRFGVSTKSIDKLIRYLNDCKSEMERMETRFVEKPTEHTA